MDAGVVTGGGSVTASGASCTIQANGVNTSGSASDGNVQLGFSGPVTITGSGVVTGGGSFTSHGSTFSVNQSGVNTGGGNILLEHSAGVTIAQGGFTSGGGNIRIISLGGIDFVAAGTVTSAGGSIYVQSETAITVDGLVSSLPGSGGVLTVKGAVALNTPPTVGAGNISFIIGGLAVPALTAWGLLALLVLIGLAAVLYLRGA
jgi:hypothetical protein